MNNEHFIPANITAKRVIQKGVHYETKIHEKTHQDAPHNNKLRTTTDLVKAKKNDCFIDFKGHKHGLFTVIKYVGNSSWSCRCVCSSYELRSSTAIKNHIKFKGELDEDKCCQCRDTQRLKNTATAKSMGYTYKEYMEKTFPRRRTLKELRLKK